MEISSLKVLNLYSSKACQDFDTQSKTIKSNSDIFPDSLYSESRDP